MPRYLFHFVASRGGEQVPDPDGVELEDLRAAHHHAMKLIRRTALFTCRRWNAREWRVQVVDIQRSETVLTVLFPVAEHYRGAEHTGSQGAANLEIRRAMYAHLALEILN
jgi:hypothetical protein